jgi:NAD(P)-dependent dehydrogenase (short-subunit alcohol dehydrogenase family)
MDLQLTGRRALVTGSSTGIGAGIARLLAQEGANVVVHGRNRERAEAVAAEIGAAGVALGDLATDQGADAVYAQATRVLGGTVEVLVNNAGGQNPSGSATKELLGQTIADWLEAYQMNTLAAVRMILRCLPDMLSVKFGRIVQISSSGAVLPSSRAPDYCGAKAAMNNLTVQLAQTLKGVGVTVNTVSPGVIVTPNLIPWARKRYVGELGWGDISDDDMWRRIALEIHNLPAGRIGIDEDIGMVVCLLASPRSGYITGANYRVDGGQIRTIN